MMNAVRTPHTTTAATASAASEPAAMPNRLTPGIPDRPSSPPVTPVHCWNTAITHIWNANDARMKSSVASCATSAMNTRPTTPARTAASKMHK
jgi:hypothetical protein